MARNIVVCFDGTNNQFGIENTNVVRLVQILNRDPTRQLVYYDPGVGTLPEPGTWTAFTKRLSEYLGLAFGRGLMWKVEEAYKYLMDFWEPGDQVFVFGFSRGAYSARVFTAALHAIGLLPRGNYNLVPYAMRIFGALRSERSSAGQWSDLCNAFRQTFGRPVPADPVDRHFQVHFIGLWDTVSSVGWAWDPKKLPYTARNPSVHVIRHALAIDERRWFFRQNRMYKAVPAQDLEQQWFPGVHSDIGGGYPEAQGGLWRAPFRWIVDGASDHGMLVDPVRLQAALAVTPMPPAPCLEMQHESLTPGWWPLEFFPKWQWRSAQHRNVLAIGMGRHRRIEDGEVLHRCALERLRQRADYRPANISAAFVQSVAALPALPDSLPYASSPVPPPSIAARA